MHATVYQAGHSATIDGTGYPPTYYANGTEPKIGEESGYYPMRIPIDLSGQEEIRIGMNVAGINCPSVTGILEYNPGDGWQSTGASVTIEGPGVTCGEYAVLPSAARGKVNLRVVLSDESGQYGAITPVAVSVDTRE